MLAVTFINLGIVSIPASTILFTNPGPIPFMSNDFTKCANILLFISTFGVSLAVVSISISTCVLFQWYACVGILGALDADGVNTFNICGMTSPLRIIIIRDPGPSTCVSINDALKPVAFDIVTPARLIGLNFTSGFI